MYEAEVNDVLESIESLPAEITARFKEFRGNVVARTTLPWGEHCTECVYPTCYTTCELYSPRSDGACRQFIDGMVRIDHAGGLSPYLLKLRFKGWAKLWTAGNLSLRSMAAAEAHERVNMVVGAVSRGMPLPAAVKPRLLVKVNYVRRRAAENAPTSTVSPDSFLLECYNPNARDITVTLTVRTAVPGSPPFQTLLLMKPGYTRSRVAFADIARAVDLTSRFEVEIVPNDCADSVLYFGLMDFVKERSQVQVESRPGGDTRRWKCIVWDLDNTLWDGTLIEDGPASIRLRQTVVDVIRETDRRGILHSIASKNNPDDALAVLRAHNLADYFLYPQIGWGPKSESVARVAASLGIGIDTLAFVDDQPFEREEVRAALPDVAIVDAAECLSIAERAECQVPVTKESMNRRTMYREQEGRDAALKAYAGDYVAFLRECHLELGLSPLDRSNLKRVYELAQRTNQMNFSGKRYPEAELEDVMVSAALETYVIDCRDRFGNYGIVGFALVDIAQPRLLDLMFSCRVQAKRVEHAVLAFLLRRFVRDQKRSLFANFRRTEKNAPAGKVFPELGFEAIGERDGVTTLVFREGQEIPDDRIVTIRHQVEAREPLPAAQSIV
jgi:FkbH-like protein